MKASVGPAQGHAQTQNDTVDREQGDSRAGTIVLIEKRSLIRDCISQCLKTATGFNVAVYQSADDWLSSGDETPASLVILCVAGNSNDPSILHDISHLARAERGVPAVLLSDGEDLDQILAALDQGVRGFIPTSLNLKIAVEALRLVKAGGTYLPASVVAGTKASGGESCEAKRFCNGMFTARQAAVVEAIRRGKANKTIAYELKMRESTVKVHVRTIMRKLKAHNRTEVAFIANGLVNGDLDISGMR